MGLCWGGRSYHGMVLGWEELLWDGIRVGGGVM